MKIKRFISFMLTLCLIASFITFSPFENKGVQAGAALNYSGGTRNSAVFIIDPGHGGSDPGACSLGRQEAADVLDLSLRVAKLIDGSGSTCALTRTTDVTQSLATKVSIANSGSFTYFLSIHRNAGGGKGVETYYYSGVSSTSTGAKLATSVQNKLIGTGLWTNRGVKTASFYVIKNTSMAAALVEVGFIDTASDNTIFANNKDTNATAIANGLLAMIGKSVSTATTNPTISNVSISNVTQTGYRVSCTVSDNVGLDRVEFPTWTHSNGQDDLIWHRGTISGSTAYYDVKISEHGNSNDMYTTHIYAYDKSGNSASAAAPDVDLTKDTSAPVITNAAITNVSYFGFDVTCNITDNKGVTKVQFPTWTSNAGQDDLIWHDVTLSGTTAKFHVDISNHKNEAGLYHVHLYAWDNWGNEGKVELSVTVPALAFPTDADYIPLLHLNAGQYESNSQILTSGTFASQYRGAAVLEATTGGYAIKAIYNSGDTKSIVASQTNPILAVYEDYATGYNPFLALEVGDVITLEGIDLAAGKIISGAYAKLPAKFVLKDTSSYTLSESHVTVDSRAQTASGVNAQFKCNVVVADVNGNLLADSAVVGTGCIVQQRNSAGAVVESAVVVIVGDVTGDGIVTAADGIDSKRALKSSVTLSEAANLAADINGDGALSTTDYVEMLLLCKTDS